MPQMSNMSKIAQNDWERYYDQAKKEYPDDETAAKVAWTIFKNKYEKNDDDRCVQKEAVEMSSDLLDEAFSGIVLKSMIEDEYGFLNE